MIKILRMRKQSFTLDDPANLIGSEIYFYFPIGNFVNN